MAKAQVSTGPRARAVEVVIEPIIAKSSLLVITADLGNIRSSQATQWQVGALIAGLGAAFGLHLGLEIASLIAFPATLAGTAGMGLLGANRGFRRHRHRVQQTLDGLLDCCEQGEFETGPAPKRTLKERIASLIE